MEQVDGAVTRPGVVIWVSPVNQDKREAYTDISERVDAATETVQRNLTSYAFKCI